MATVLTAIFGTAVSAAVGVPVGAWAFDAVMQVASRAAKSANKAAVNAAAASEAAAGALAAGQRVRRA